MKLNKLHIAILLLLCGAAASCNRAEQPVTEPQTKSPIELSVGGVDSDAGVTKAVVTDGTTNTTFGRDTKVFILMKSDRDHTEHNGFEYKGSHADVMYTVSRGDIYDATNPTALVFDSVNQKYWDDAHARSSQLTMWAVAQRISQPEVDGKWKDITLQKIHGEDPMTSETTRDKYNTAVRNEFQSDKTVYPVIYTWNVGNPAQNQTEHTIIYQDLMFSNNLADYTGEEWDDDHKNIPVESRTDNRLKFDFGTRHFPASSEMKFYHAMSKITIQIKAGDGFKADGSDFKLKNNTLDLIHGINTCGLFNIKDGEFQKIHAAADITTIPLTKTVKGKSEPYYTLEALAIPNIHQFLKKHTASDPNSRFVNGDNTVMMEITIDNNKYKITSDNLFDAVNGKTNATTLTDNETYVPLEAGKNYVFTFVIGKQKIERLTAQVADWENVVADEQTPTNARINLRLEERGDPVTTDAKFYKAEDNNPGEIDDDFTSYKWDTGYTDMSATYNAGHWTTSLFWESNKDFYHFRSFMPATAPVTHVPSGKDYISLTSAKNYTDVRWGAPMVESEDNETADSFKWTYGADTNGFDGADNKAADAHQISKAIGPTKNTIKLVLFHMMSELIINVKTSDESDKVELCHEYVEDEVTKHERTRVDLVGFKANGKVLLGTGLVQADGEASTKLAPVNIPYNANNPETFAPYELQNYKFGAVPQNLENVQLYITTPDHNQYIVDLATVKASTVSTNNIENPYKVEDGGTKYVIDRWYPGFRYTYNFTLRKTEISKMTATVVEWESIEADDEEITIK